MFNRCHTTIHVARKWTWSSSAQRRVLPWRLSGSTMSASGRAGTRPGEMRMRTVTMSTQAGEGRASHQAPHCWPVRMHVVLGCLPLMQQGGTMPPHRPGDAWADVCGGVWGEGWAGQYAQGARATR